MRSGSGSDDDDARAGGVQRPEQPEVLVRRRDDLVAGAELQAGEDDVAAIRRRRSERDVLAVDADELGDVCPQRLTHLQEMREPSEASTTLPNTRLLLRAHRLDRSACEGPDAPGLEVGVALEHGKLRACLLGGHAPDSDRDG